MLSVLLLSTVVTLWCFCGYLYWEHRRFVASVEESKKRVAEYRKRNA